MDRIGKSHMMRTSEGFSLIELMITIVILAVLMLTTGLICMGLNRAVILGDNMTSAFNLARTQLANINTTAYANLAITNANGNSWNVVVPRRADCFGNIWNQTFKITQIVTQVANMNNVKLARVVISGPNNPNPLINIGTYVLDIKSGVGGRGRDVEASYVSFQMGGIDPSTPDSITNIRLRTRCNRCGLNPNGSTQHNMPSFWINVRTADHSSKYLISMKASNWSSVWTPSSPIELKDGVDTLIIPTYSIAASVDATEWVYGGGPTQEDINGNIRIQNINFTPVSPKVAYTVTLRFRYYDTNESRNYSWSYTP